MNVPQHSIIPINLATAGSLDVGQISGVVRLIEVVDVAGALDLTGLLSIRMGEAERDEIPMRLGQAIKTAQTMRLRITWAAQAGLTAKVLLTPDDRVFDMDAKPPAQLILGDLAGSISTGKIDVANTATLIKAANTSRKGLLIVNEGTATVFIGTSGVSTTDGYALGAGGAMTLGGNTAEIYGIVASGTEEIRYLEEG